MYFVGFLSGLCKNRTIIKSTHSFMQSKSISSIAAFLVHRTFNIEASFVHQCVAQILIFILVSIGQFSLFNFSFNYVVIPSFVIWYFPLGFQFIIFIFLPYRFWVSAILAICFASGLTMQVQESIYYDMFKHFVQTLFMTVHMLPIIYFAREHHINRHLFTLKSISLIVFLGMLTRFTSVGYSVLSQTSVYDKVAASDVLDMFILHNIAAYPGLLFAITLFLIVMWILQFRYKIPEFSKAVLLQNIFLLTLAMVFAFYTNAFTRELLKLFLFLPIIYFAIRLTWFGSLCCALWINTVLLIFLHNADSQLLVDFQTFIAAYFATGLVTAALQLEHSRATSSLFLRQTALEAQNAELLISKNDLQNLSKQAVNIREAEKKRLSQELHDDVGQSIIGLRALISVLEKKFDIARRHPELLNDIKIECGNLYNNAYRLMYWLRPKNIDDAPLNIALSKENFNEYLGNNFIEYHAYVTEDLIDLTDTNKITIVRMVQECIKNTVEHSEADSCSISIEIEDKQVHLSFCDNGIGFNDNTLAGNYGDGLFMIYNYVIALGGKMQLHNTNGANIDVWLPL